MELDVKFGHDIVGSTIVPDLKEQMGSVEVFLAHIWIPLNFVHLTKLDKANTQKIEMMLKNVKTLY